MWRIIDDEGTYSVSDNGEVRNNKTGRMLKPFNTYNGYLRVYIHGKCLRVHRLVAEHFLQNENGYPQVNHKDGNKRNNKADNLEWCTARENLKHAYRTGLKRVHYDNICLPRPVIQLSIDGDVLAHYDSIKAAERCTGFDNSSISAACKGRRKTAYGYKWQYASL